jgi:hypothetical protein
MLFKSNNAGPFYGEMTGGPAVRMTKTHDEIQL